MEFMVSFGANPIILNWKLRSNSPIGSKWLSIKRRK